MSNQKIVIKKIEPVHVLSIRQKLSGPGEVASLMGQSFGALLASQIGVTGQPLAIFYDQDFKPTDLDVEIAFPVAPLVNKPAPIDAERKLSPRNLPGIEQAACLIHHDVFEKLPETYQALGDWIATNGYRVAGPYREVYLSPPDQEGKAMTEVQCPVEKS